MNNVQKMLVNLFTRKFQICCLPASNVYFFVCTVWGLSFVFASVSFFDRYFKSLSNNSKKLNIPRNTQWACHVTLSSGVILQRWSTWMFESERRERRMGVTVLDIMSWDGKTGHRVGFIRITLTYNICFGRNLLHLKVDILSFLYIYVSCIWGEYSWRFRLFYLRVCEERRQSRQRTHPVYFINLRKAHYFVVIMTIQK